MINIAARRDINRILNIYMNTIIYTYPIGTVHSMKEIFPLKALKRSRNASKNEAGVKLNSVLSILPSKRNTRMTKPKVKKNLESSFFI